MGRSLDETEVVVGLAGDWECNAPWARQALATFAEHEITTVFHLGDLSILPGPRGRQFLSEVEGACRRHRITSYLTPGNHEDYTAINALPVGDDGLRWVSEHLGVLPRGHRWTMAGRSFVSLGGAPSLDFPHRIEGQTWWPEEMITDLDVDRVAAGGRADVMLAHDAPAPATPAVDRIVAGGGGWHWSKRGLAHAAVGRERMTRAFQAVQPRLFAHGHFHVHDEALLHPDGWGHPCRMLSLNRDGQRGNMAVLDLSAEQPSTEPGDPGIRYRWLTS